MDYRLENVIGRVYILAMRYCCVYIGKGFVCTDRMVTVSEALRKAEYRRCD